MAISFKRAAKRPMYVNMIPLINVIFLLLIFFIVTGTYQDDTPDDVSLPLAESGKDMGDQPLRLTLTADGMVTLNDIPVKPTSIYRTLSSLLEERKDLDHANVIIMADAGLEADALLYVIASVKQAGIQEVSLVTAGL